MLRGSPTLGREDTKPGTGDSAVYTRGKELLGINQFVLIAPFANRSSIFMYLYIYICIDIIYIYRISYISASELLWIQIAQQIFVNLLF